MLRQKLGDRPRQLSVNGAVRLGPDDLAGLQRLARSMLRCPFSLQRLIKVTPEGKVIYLAEKRVCRRFPKPASVPAEPLWTVD